MLGPALVAALVISGAAKASQPVYEPNDSPETATGPLAISSTYEAALETSNDKDYFYFYVTAPTTAQVRLTYKNLGGGSDFSARLEDSHGNTIEYEYEVADYKIEAVTLTPGKYYVEILGDSAGQRYSISTEGTDGSFGSFATIQANCAAAQATVGVSQEVVTHAVAKQTKAKERRRRAFAHMHRVERHSGYRAKQKARHQAGYAEASYRAATAALREAEKEYKGVTKLESPWCFIPQ